MHGFITRYSESVTLVVAGGREAETDELIALANNLLCEHVRFAVDLPRSAMPDLYRTADAFVLTSLFETFGIVLIEAMASGLPLICHDATWISICRRPGRLFHRYERGVALTEALLAMTEVGQREHLAFYARKQVEENFAESVVLDQILDMYYRVSEGDVGTIVC